MTEVIKSAGLMGYLPEDQYFLDRGSYVHEAIAMYLKGTLDETALAEGIKPFVDSAIEYITVTGYKAREIELPLYDPIYKYCGTIDALPLRDWKTGGKSFWHSAQIVAYSELCKANNIDSGIPLNVHLSDKGKMPKVEPYTLIQLRDAKRTFFAALYLYQVRKNNGLLTKEKP